MKSPMICISLDNDIFYSYENILFLFEIKSGEKFYIILILDLTWVASEYGVFDDVWTRIDRKTSLFSDWGFMAGSVFIMEYYLSTELDLVTLFNHIIFKIVRAI